MEVKIQKLRPGAVTPRRGSADAAGYDLYACPADGQSVTIAPHATAMIGTGLALAIPAGYFGGVFARSGLASRQGLRPANCVGVIDADYRGECTVALHNDTDAPRTVAPGDRIGAIERNCLFGIFGTLDAPPDGDAIETASADAVKTGSATILSTVAGEDVRAYTVDISRVYHDGGGTRFLITVTDPDLLAATGGIVQGMSGSPILQNGRLIGAVTHVLLSDPAKGYGVSIDDMLAASAAQDKAA